MATPRLAESVPSSSGEFHRTDGRPQPFRDLLGFGPAGFGQENGELLAPVAAGDVEAPNTLDATLSRTPQDAISDQMAEGVIDLLEVVEVDHDHRKLARAPLCLLHLRLPVREEPAPGVEACERVR
jgi:hypothetical protein